MEGYVIRIDDLDKQINDSKQAILRGVPVTEEDLALLFQKVILREQLNQELQKIREGKYLMMCVAYYYVLSRHLERNQLLQH